MQILCSHLTAICRRERTPSTTSNAGNSPLVWDDGRQPAWLSFAKDRTLYRNLAADGVRTESNNVHDGVVIDREAMRVHTSSW